MSRVAVVIEDDQDIREVIRHVLLASGFAVYPAATGLEGVAAVRLHNPAIVTLDLILPDIDGFEVARQVREFSDTYIIMVTARNEELDTLMGLESGADDFVTKPFRPRELRARVEALLRRSRGRDHAGTRRRTSRRRKQFFPPAAVRRTPRLCRRRQLFRSRQFRRRSPPPLLWTGLPRWYTTACACTLPHAP